MSTMAPAHLRVRFAPHRVNGWFLRIFARPYVRIDDDEYATRWGRGLSVDLEPGTHRVDTFIRYHHVRVDLGTGYLPLTAEPGQDLQLVCRNGWANHTPFVPRLAA